MASAASLCNAAALIFTSRPLFFNTTPEMHLPHQLGMEGLKLRSLKSFTVARTSMLGDMVRPNGGSSSSSSGSIRRRRRRDLSLIAMCEGGAQSTATVEAATAETVERVVGIVATQLGTSSGTVHPHSRFQELGADSLDQVEIVMALEEEFGISVSESGAESISTVQDAANLIQAAISEKSR